MAWYLCAVLFSALSHPYLAPLLDSALRCVAAMSLFFIFFGHHIVPQWILPAATTWSDEPTVDRTLAGLNFKSTITLAMAISQFFAAALRLTLLLRDKLDTVQQEMLVKNLLFLVPGISAILKIFQIKGRYVCFLYSSFSHCCFLLPCCWSSLLHTTLCYF